MSTKQALTQISRFLGTADPEVLCVAGEWGVGKSYLWRAQLVKEKSNLKLTHYSYVSLFGINSLDELRQAIFANRLPNSKIGQRLTLKDWEEQGRRHSGALRNMMGAIPLGIGDALKAAAPFLLHSIQDQLICIDDLERKGRDLSIRDALGLISLLRDEHGCKIVLLSNTNGFATADDKMDFDNQLEKVVDHFVTLAPTAHEAASVALDDAYSVLAERCIALEISNIRVMVKIKRLYDQLKELVSEFSPDVAARVAHDLALLGWIKFSNIAPSVKFLSDRHDIRLRRQREKEKNDNFSSEEEEDHSREGAWNALLDKYGIYLLDDLGITLWEGIEKGYFDLDQVRARCVGVQKSAKASEAEHAQHQAWQVYNSTFAHNEDEVVQSLFDTHLKYITYTSLGNLDGVVRILRRLNRDDLAENLITEYLAQNADKRGAFDVKEQRFFARDISDKQLVDAANKKYASFADDRAPFAAILEIGSRGGDEEDYAIAARITADDLVAEFKSRHGDDLRNAISACLKSDRIINARDEERTVSAAAKEALRRIGQENGLNLVRVERFLGDV